nr:prolipoprotein diacylglyceryl transferase [Deferrisoma camini]
MIPYPSIDPVAFRIGPLAVRWYGIAYLLGFLSAAHILRRLARSGRAVLAEAEVGDLVGWLALGVILGGRLGYVVFYNLPYFAAQPWKIVAVWEGGMSFHGGLAGVGLAAWAYARRRDLSLLGLADALAVATPPGVFFGRLANFVNGELYGRVTDVPWAMVFPAGGPLPRHPSQLYEAMLEGPLLGLALWWFWKRFPQRGAATSAFLVGYGILRFAVEFTRQPDPQLGFVAGPFTMGQLLSLAMIAAGAWIWAARKR